LTSCFERARLWAAPKKAFFIILSSRRSARERCDWARLRDLLFPHDTCWLPSLPNVTKVQLPTLYLR